LVFVVAAVSGAPLTTFNYEGVACAEKCSCRRDFFAFSTGKMCRRLSKAAEA